MNSLRITLQRLQNSIRHFGLALLILAGALALHGNTSLLYAQSTEICDNGIDDDGDTLIDCDDPDCRFPLFDGGSYGSSRSNGVALGDLDGDGDLDAWVANDGQPFRVWINDGLGNYTDSGQALGNSWSRDVALGDLDGDGDLDAWVANYNQPNRVWVNDGFGSFTDSGQVLGNSYSFGIALGDLDGDGDLDAWVANSEANRVWINDGFGNFTDSGQALGGSASRDVDLGDLDGDGDLDAWIANSSNQPNRVWINDGNGNFTDSGQGQIGSVSVGVALGDIDSDGDLDAWVANGSGTVNQPNRVWINDGNGNFSDSGQALGNSNSWDVALGDLDGDGDLDAFLTNGAGGLDQPNRVWRNDGFGNFTDSTQALGASASVGIALGDLDGDGDLDAWVANLNNQPNRVWINAGFGYYTEGGQVLGNSDSFDVALGDLDGDGDLDAWVANYGQPNRVWVNDGFGSFTDSGQALGNSYSLGIALGDLDGDGDLDAWVANSTLFGSANGSNRTWINQGGSQGGTPGIFADSGQALGNSDSRGVALGDLDGDGDLDAWVANYDQNDRVWINQGGSQGGTPGFYTDSGQFFGFLPSTDVALGDLDGDGDLDAWVVNQSQIAYVYINQGGTQSGTPGSFANSGQFLGTVPTSGAVALGDFDGDGDLDAWVAYSYNNANRVWLNDGLGFFLDSGQTLGNSYSLDVAIGDLDGDGDLDAWVANSSNRPNRVWINDGNGNFSDSGQALGNSDSFDVALGDLDGDGDLDACVANWGGEADRVWINQIACFNEDETPFIRGDFNGDGGVDIGDAIATLDYLFTGGSIDCDDAADSNDDGAIDVADGIQILGYLFSGTGDLPNPFPTCGTDPTPDTLECESYNGC